MVTSLFELTALLLQYRLPHGILVRPRGYNAHFEWTFIKTQSAVQPFSV